MNAKEEMFGTVPRVDVWFLLEYREAWAEKAFPSSNIPDKVKRHLSNYLESIPNSRLQLIKRHDRSSDLIKFYLGVSDEIEPRLFEFTLSNYEDLLEFDIPKILNDSSFLRKDPLILVCAHGTHDTCCGKFGVPVYMEALKYESGFMTWKCTHLGGHRFAANFLFLPQGIYYGRVRESDADDLIKEYQSQRIYLENYRGRSCYSNEAQAAEYFLRMKTGTKEISAFRIKKTKKDGDNSTIEFLSLTNGKIYIIHIQTDKNAISSYTSCKDKDKSPVAQYRLVDYKEI
ncbi:MAG TPA: sucrase ferredoxin [Thermodesulfobacteriota bacterium]|nr:sucrase ferredoxin [Thermodesulfobacteriota bacterium]